MQELENYFFSYKPYLSILIIVLSVVIWNNLKRIFTKHIKKSDKANFSSVTWQLTLNGFKYIIGFVVIIIVMQINGINVTSIAAGVGVISVVIGFALQDYLNDWVMGLSIVWEGYFSVGDVVKYQDWVGQVTKFNFKMTKIVDINTGDIVVVSNRHLSEIVILSKWFDYDIPASYEVDKENMDEVMEKIAQRISQIKSVSESVYLGTQAFEASSILYRIRIFCHPEARNAIKREANGIVQEIYQEQALSIPYDQIDIHYQREKDS